VYGSVSGTADLLVDRTARTEPQKDSQLCRTVHRIFDHGYRYNGGYR